MRVSRLAILAAACACTVTLAAGPASADGPDAPVLADGKTSNTNGSFSNGAENADQLTGAGANSEIGMLAVSSALVVAGGGAVLIARRRRRNLH